MTCLYCEDFYSCVQRKGLGGETGRRQHFGVAFCVRRLTSDLFVFCLGSLDNECAGNNLSNRNANPFKCCVTYSTI